MKLIYLKIETIEDVQDDLAEHSKRPVKACIWDDDMDRDKDTE